MHVPSYCSSPAPRQPLSRSCFQCRAYKTVSYLVQQLFSHFQGVIAAATSVKTTFGDVHQELVAASTTCQDAKCEKVAVKVTHPCGPTDLHCHEPIPGERGLRSGGHLQPKRLSPFAGPQSPESVPVGNAALAHQKDHSLCIRSPTVQY